MEEEGKYQEIRSDPVDVHIERGHEYKEEDRENRHLPENRSSFLVFVRKQHTVQDEWNRNGDENGKKSHEREDVREDDGSLKGSEKDIGEEECEESAQKSRGDTPETGKSYGDRVYSCRSE